MPPTTGARCQVPAGNSGPACRWPTAKRPQTPGQATRPRRDSRDLPERRNSAQNHVLSARPRDPNASPVAIDNRLGCRAGGVIRPSDLFIEVGGESMGAAANEPGSLNAYRGGGSSRAKQPQRCREEDSNSSESVMLRDGCKAYALRAECPVGEAVVAFPIEWLA